MNCGERPQRTFRQAATKYLNEATKRSIERDARALQILDPHIGDYPIERVHAGTLSSSIDTRRAEGTRSGTVRRELAVVRRILNLAARLWRDEQDRPWLDSPPLLQMPDWRDARKPYPLAWDEQARLLQALPEHLHRMALYALHTGCREQEICSLRWEWEAEVADMQAFILPGEPHEDWQGTKNGEDRVVVLNRVARSVIDACRGEHPVHVFTYAKRGQTERARVLRMFNSAWKRARASVGLPQVRIHDLRHTFGRRLRATGVSLETRKASLGHTNGDITTHYSMPELRELERAVELIADARPGKNPAVTLIRAIGSKRATGN